jgi:hypothetical protein
MKDSPRLEVGGQLDGAGASEANNVQSDRLARAITERP